MTWRSLCHYWEDMGGDPELDLPDDELALRDAEAQAEVEAAEAEANRQSREEPEPDLPF